MAKKRASMREGPLADLFRSTDESVREDEITVTATADAGSGVEVALAEEITVERTEDLVEEAPVQEPPPVEEPPAEEPPAEEPPPRSPPPARR